MKTLTTLIIMFFLTSNVVSGQDKNEIDSLLQIIAKTYDSKNIIKDSQALKIIEYGDKVVPLLSTYFTDTTTTQIKSEFMGFYLRKGEIAIILTDHIEIFMPYALLTGIQNCMLYFCEDNPNKVEYYLGAVRRDGGKQFQQKYLEWLASKDRKWIQAEISKAKKRMKKRKSP